MNDGVDQESSRPRSSLTDSADQKQAERVEVMFDRIAGRYDFINSVMTFGQDGRWRRRTVAAPELPARAPVLGVACGGRYRAG